MDFDEYQQLATRTAHFKDKEAEFELLYLGLGITSEAGEVADKIKKMFRNDNGVMSPERLDGLKKEIGDVLWYASQLSRVLGLKFSEVAETNIAKLADRLDRGVVRSDGDDR